MSPSPSHAAHEQTLDLIFHALADQTRRALLRRIAEAECRVTDLAAPFAMSLNAVSKHLKILERAGFLQRTRDGRVHRCRMDPAPLAQVDQVVAFYRRFWSAHLDRLGTELEELSHPGPISPAHKPGDKT